MIFSLRQLQEKCNEQNKDLYIAFIDLAKAFDTVNRELLWQILERFGTPPKFLSILKLEAVGQYSSAVGHSLVKNV